MSIFYAQIIELNKILSMVALIYQQMEVNIIVGY